MKKKPLQKFPTLKTDAEAEHFVDTADLSEYDLRGTPVRFEFQPKDTQINIRLSEALAAAVKAKARALGIPYQRFVRLVLEQAVR